VHGAGADDTDRPEVPPPLPRPPAPSSRILTDGFGACRATRASHLCADDDEELEESGEDDDDDDDDDDDRVEAWSESPFAEWDVSRSHRERDGPTGTANGATGTTQLGRLGPRLGRLGPFPKGDWALHTGDSAHTGGDSRNRLSAPGAATLHAGASVGPRMGDSLAPLAPSPLARRPRRARLGPATCARRGRLALSPLPCAPPLPVRPLPT